MSASASIDPRLLREALGSFATGITVVTTVDQQGNDIGLTANSFNSVSLSPPMVLWSLAKTSHSAPAFSAATFFAVHVLAAEQEQLSNVFAKGGVDKFAGRTVERGQGGIPLLDGCAARFQCRTAFRYEGGDHDIFVGEVVDFQHFDRRPLIYHKGQYSLVMKKGRDAALASNSQGEGSFSGNFLGFLLGRAHFMLFDSIRQALARLGITLDQYFALCALGYGESRTAEELDKMARRYDRSFGEDSLRDLLARGLLEAEDSDLKLTLAAKGKALLLELLAIGKDAEAEAQQALEFGEAQLLHSCLKRMVQRTPRSG